MWPDNLRLLQQSTFSSATLKRCLRQLGDKGLVAFRDSPNGKRFGRRDASGQIVIASSYGIDLSPVGVRATELEAIADEEDALQFEFRQLSRRWTCDRRKLAGIIDAAEAFEMDGPWHECDLELQNLAIMRRKRCTLERLRDLCDALSAVLERARTAYAAVSDKFETYHRPYTSEKMEDCQKHTKLSPKGIVSEPHIQNTKQITHQSLYNERRSAKAEQVIDQLAGKASRKKAMKKPVVDDSHVQSSSCCTADGIPDLKLVLQACPEFAAWGYQEITDWRDMIVRAEQIRPMLGISADAWSDARMELGKHMSATAIAVIYQKYTANGIREPGGYLRSITDRSREGELRLDLTLWSLKTASIDQNHGQKGPQLREPMSRMNRKLVFSPRLI